MGKRGWVVYLVWVFAEKDELEYDELREEKEPVDEVLEEKVYVVF